MRFLLYPITLIFVLMAFGCPAQKGKSPLFGFNQVHTNVIVIITDDQGYGDISAHGNPYLNTPNLDALHKDSVRLTNFHVDPTCSPSRAALATGRYSSRVGVWLTYGGRNHLRKDEMTMAEVFNNSGYKTAMFGKWHLGDNYPFRPQDRGFEESLIHGGGVVGETPDFWNNDYYDDTYLRNGEPEKTDGYCTDVWFREAGDWIEKNQNEPFFVYLATNAPHGPLHAPIEFIQPFLDAGIPERRARFYGMIKIIDENLGRLRSRLEEMEIAENTLIIFMTDNGSAAGAELTEIPNGFVETGYNAGMRGMKTSAYEGGHRAAGFFHWPKGELIQGNDVPHLTAHIDVLPTLVELCNLKVPGKVQFDGVDLTPLLRGDPDLWEDRSIVVHHQGRFGDFVGEGLLIKNKDYSVMTDQWRLVGEELYDLSIDSGQRSDVAAVNPKVVKKLKETYETWWKDIAKRSHEYVPFVIDDSKQKCYTFSSQNWHGDAVPYSQQHVRTGMKANGFWAIDVVESGSYDISVRRWPKEVDAPIGGTVELGPYVAELHNHSSKIINTPTLAIPVKAVRLKVGDYDQTVSVYPTDEEARFSVYLSGGEQKIQSWLIDDGNESRSAYYVYLTKS
ncbi:MAG: arylsulfatase [Verrucomicrobia bacterium]|nr:arylsulfatase [Verrucomicrobiota bacterium]MDA1066160.1 arylsulfatase [Verrucomicrobiota bacterium]